MGGKQSVRVPTVILLEEHDQQRDLAALSVWRISSTQTLDLAGIARAKVLIYTKPPLSMVDKNYLSSPGINGQSYMTKHYFISGSFPSLCVWMVQCRPGYNRHAYHPSRCQGGFTSTTMRKRRIDGV